MAFARGGQLAQHVPIALEKSLARRLRRRVAASSSLRRLLPHAPAGGGPCMGRATDEVPDSAFVYYCCVLEGWPASTGALNSRWEPDPSCCAPSRPHDVARPRSCLEALFLFDIPLVYFVQGDELPRPVLLSAHRALNEGGWKCTPALQAHAPTYSLDGATLTTTKCEQAHQTRYCWRSYYGTGPNVC